MTRFALLVRGINVGGKNKVVMAEFREELKTIGLDEVETYINSGNIFFESAASKEELVDLLGHFFRDRYPFIQSFSLFSAEDYEQDIAALPVWWQEDLARKDVLFYTEGLDQEAVWELVSSFSLGDEIIHRGNLGIYWGKYSEETYTKTAYHRQVLKMPVYRLLTIRNANTFDKIGQFLRES